MKKALIAITAVIAAIIIAFCAFIKINYGSKTFYSFDSVGSRDAHFFLLEQGISKDELIEEERLSDFGNYDNYYFQFRRNTEFIFTSYGETIICDYSKENYKLQKAKLLKNSFFSGSVTDDYDNRVLTEAQTDIGKWHFMVMNEQYTCLPKNFRILGYNDSLNKIAILSFSDQDLDYMDESLKEFIEYYFRYNFEK